MSLDNVALNIGYDKWYNTYVVSVKSDVIDFDVNANLVINQISIKIFILQ